MQKSIVTLAAEAGITPFEAFVPGRHSDKGLSQLAELELAGRSHYYDRETREAFEVKVHTVHTMCSRLVLGTVISKRNDGHRVVQAVLHRADGKLLFQSSRTNLTVDEAVVEMQYEASRLTELTLVRDMMNDRIKDAQATIRAAETCLRRLDRLPP